MQDQCFPEITKPELLDQAVLYMKVFALGMPATAVYNFGNGVLSARGDTKRPMYYLAFAGILNVLLNLIFVIVFHMVLSELLLPVQSHSTFQED